MWDLPIYAQAHVGTRVCTLRSGGEWLGVEKFCNARHVPFDSRYKESDCQRKGVKERITSH